MTDMNRKILTSLLVAALGYLTSLLVADLWRQYFYPTTEFRTIHGVISDFHATGKRSSRIGYFSLVGESVEYVMVCQAAIEQAPMVMNQTKVQFEVGVNGYITQLKKTVAWGITVNGVEFCSKADEEARRQANFWFLLVVTTVLLLLFIVCLVFLWRQYVSNYQKKANEEGGSPQRNSIAPSSMKVKVAWFLIAVPLVIFGVFLRVTSTQFSGLLQKTLLDIGMIYFPMAFFSFVGIDFFKAKNDPGWLRRKVWLLKPFVLGLCLSCLIVIWET
jgi:hypothetical protein